MRKSTTFISAVLTTFALVTLYGVVSAYRSISTVTEASAMAMEIDTPTTAPTLEPTVEPTITPTIITPEQAAQLAAQVVGNSNLLSAESANLNGTDAYKIVFINNDVVYVGLTGQILTVQIAPVVVNVAPPAKTRNRNRDNNNNTNVASNNGGETENHDDHENHDN
jgi:hypothetical protein